MAPKDTFTTGDVKIIEAYHPIPQIVGLKRRFVIAGGGDDVETNGLGGSSSSVNNEDVKRKRENLDSSPVKSGKEKVGKSEKQKKSKKDKK